MCVADWTVDKNTTITLTINLNKTIHNNFAPYTVCGCQESCVEIVTTDCI